MQFYESDDAKWGALMRRACNDLSSGKTEKGVAADMAAARILLAGCMEMNATESTVTLNGATWRGADVGDWEVVMRRIKEPQREPTDADADAAYEAQLRTHARTTARTGEDAF